MMMGHLLNGCFRDLAYLLGDC